MRPVVAAAYVAVIVAIASLVVPGQAWAQWVWKDAGGQVVASDQPPPIGIPQSSIIKQPRARAATAPVVDKEAAPKDKADAPKSLADRDLESKQRQKEAAEASKKSDDEAAKAKSMQENCTAVRGNLAALQNGGRAARYNEKGEKSYIDDSQRQTEISKSQGQIAQYCK